MNVNFCSHIYRIICIVLFSVTFSSCGGSKLLIDVKNSVLFTPFDFSSLAIQADISGGTFKSSPIVNINLSSNVSPQIWSCVSSVNSYDTAQCCDPLTDGSSSLSSTKAVLVPNTDGIYCVSYIGFASNEDETSVKYTVIEIDSSIDDFDVKNNIYELQSTSLLQLELSTSVFGSSDHEYSLFTLNQQAQDSCSNLLAINFASSGMSFDGDSTPDKINLSTLAGPTSSISLMGRDFNFTGEKYVYNVLDNNASGKTACSIFAIQIRDFTVFSLGTNGDATLTVNNNLNFVGSFTSVNTGKHSPSTGSVKLINGFNNIIY